MKVVAQLGDCTFVLSCPGSYQPDVMDDLVTRALAGVEQMYDKIPTLPIEADAPAADD